MWCIYFLIIMFGHASTSGSIYKTSVYFQPQDGGGGNVMPKSVRAKNGPPVQLWRQANFDPLGPILVAKTGPPAPKMDPVRYWLAKNGPSPILACQKRTQSDIGCQKRTQSDIGCQKWTQSLYWLSYINWLAKLVQ